MKFIRLLLVAAALGCAYPAIAADKKAPSPAKPPTRVPFTAFRTKPILDLHDKASDAPYKLTVGKKPKLIHVNPDAVGQSIVVTPAPSMLPGPLIVKKAKKPNLEILRAPALAVEKIAPEPEIAEDTRSAVFINGIPVPGHKPGPNGEGGSLFDRIIAMPATTHEMERARVAVPAPPEMPQAIPDQAQQQPQIETTTPRPPAAEDVAAADAVTDANEAYVPPTPIVSNDGLRVRRMNRFADDDRTAGSGFGAAAQNHMMKVSALSLPHDMRGVSLSPDANGDISPVLLPGNTQTVAAPDAPRESPAGTPSDVIVFFMEASPKMEVGQLDVVNNDVVAAMQENPDLRLEIVGFSENLGGPDQTEKMAAARASALRDYLKSQHISGNRLTVKAKGDDTDVEPRDRVEMVFTR